MGSRENISVQCLGPDALATAAWLSSLLSMHRDALAWRRERLAGCFCVALGGAQIRCCGALVDAHMAEKSRWAMSLHELIVAVGLNGSVASRRAVARRLRAPLMASRRSSAKAPRHGGYLSCIAWHQQQTSRRSTKTQNEYEWRMENEHSSVCSFR
jgi:hypothetical protein